MTGQDTERVLRVEVLIELGGAVARRQVIRRERSVHVESHLECKHAPHLFFGQRASAIPLDRDGLERASRHVVPSRAERGRDVRGELDGAKSLIKRHLQPRPRARRSDAAPQVVGNCATWSC